MGRSAREAIPTQLTHSRSDRNEADFLLRRGWLQSGHTTVARPSPPRRVSDQVHCRVAVAVMGGVACRAGPGAHPAGHLVLDDAAGRAELAARKEAAGRHHDRAAPLGLALHRTTERAKTHVGDSPGQTVVADHPPHVRMLDADHVEPARELRGEPVHGVLPDVRNPGVKPRKLGSRLGAVLRALLLSAQTPAETARRNSRLSALRPQIALARRERDERENAEVHPDSSLAFCWTLWLILGVDRDRHEQGDRPAARSWPT